MLKRKKAFKILFFVFVLLGGILLPNITFNAIETNYSDLNYVIVLQNDDVETNVSYIRILYYIEDDYSITPFSNTDNIYINDNREFNLLGYNKTIYCVNAIIDENTIIISDLYNYEEFLSYINDMFYNNGYTTGYNNGLNVNDNTKYNEGYNNGYNEGFNVGSNSGYSNGYNEGLTIGYNNGYLEGQTSNEDNFSLLSLFSLILMYPFKVIALGMDVEIFGINIGGIIIALLAIGLVVGIISIFKAGGKDE